MVSPSHRATRPLLAALGLALATVLVPGCSESYSESMVYPLRSDPILDLSPEAKGVEYPDPARPGQMPVFTLKDLEDDRNPLYPQRETLLKENRIRDPKRLDADTRTELDEVLTEVFGTPARPRVDMTAAGVPTNLIESYSAKLGLSGDALERGSKLYRQHCLQCHGLTGDGRGPTAKWVSPHPRDYRPALFKFTSVDQVDFAKGRDPDLEQRRRPRREDLHRTLHQGLENTAMPAFNLLTEPELQDLVSYVMHLSMRGYAEYTVLTQLPFTEKDGFGEPPWPGGVSGYLKRSIGQGKKKGALRLEIELWYESQDKLIVPFSKDRDDRGDKLIASIQRGSYLFKGEDNKGNKIPTPATCVSCHKDYGRQAQFKYDDWATLVRPNNLTLGVYRGGRRPIDIYWRIHSGIAGSGMNKFGKVVVGKTEGEGTYTSDQIWDLVNFVRALPYPSMRKDAGIDLK